MVSIIKGNGRMKDFMPLAEKLSEYGRTDIYPLHMPGHKRQLRGSMSEEIFRIDITEVDGFDNLHRPEGILRKMQEHAAALYGAGESFYLINGSTCGILSAVSAAVPRRGHILIARNCHKSVYHACYLRDLTISYLYPEMVEGFHICEAVTAGQVEAALLQEPDIDAVLIVSPTYEGRIAEVAAIAEVVHSRGIPLIVDEAHGAHLGFAEGFAKNSCQLGADLVIHSVHKTLPAMTQTALLHVRGGLIDRGRLKRFLHIYQSSSPSYVLMASIENALLQIEQEGVGLFGRFIRNWDKMCADLSTMQRLSILFPGEKQDVGKLLVSVQKTGLSGQQLYDMLLEEYHLQLEMAAPGYVLAMFTVGDAEEGYERLTKALLEIDGRLIAEGAEQEQRCDHAAIRESIRLTAKESDELKWHQEPVSFAEAWEMETEWCAVPECAGRYCGDFINIYPPGTPEAVPGEIIDDALISWVADCVKEGLAVQGIRYDDGKIYLPVLKI